MKKLLAVILIATFHSFLHAADVLPINEYKGINTDDSPITLQGGQTPESENVVTDDGFGLKGRKGFVRYSTETSSGLWEFPLSNGTRYLITKSGGTLKATTDGNFSVYIGTVPTDRTVAGSVLGDRFYYSDTLNGLKYWTGSAVVTSSKTMTFDKLVTWKVACRGWKIGRREDHISLQIFGRNELDFGYQSNRRRSRANPDIRVS